MLNAGSFYLKLVKKFVVKFLIGFLSLIYGVKNDGIAFALLNFNCKLFAGKNDPDISLPNVPAIDESNLVGDEDMLNMEPVSGLMKSHILKTLIHKAKVLQEIIVISIIRKVFDEEMLYGPMRSHILKGFDPLEE
ncbi:unnamed protein product [Vicia faba]|uniref:Uncharacterized protein n=1 Tax=Vicia faba TaxID=3906 RepID=A0AAV0Z8B1_VICFA|nr:unnamed protein product [Vicia faba]